MEEVGTLNGVVQPKYPRFPKKNTKKLSKRQASPLNQMMDITSTPKTDLDKISTTSLTILLTD